MKKITSWAAAIIIAASLIFFVVLGTYHFEHKQTVNIYHRFQRVDSMGNKSFNPWALIFAGQEEWQRVVNDTFVFSQKVIYPLADHFDCTGFTDARGEEYVASIIAKKINDTVNKIRQKHLMDYDGTSQEVRRAWKLKTTQLMQPRVELMLYGTASPEAAKYGFDSSIAIGHKEPENLTLAYERVRRTQFLVEKKLPEINLIIKKLDWEEVQPKNQEMVEAIKRNHAILDSMRYVRLIAKIYSQHLEVTTVTTPIMLPFWFLLALGLIWLWNKLRAVKIPNLGQISFGKWEDWLSFLWLVIECALLVLALMCLAAGLIILWRVLVVIGTIMAIILIVKLLTSVYWRQLFLNILTFLELVYCLLAMLLEFILGLFRNLWYWWCERIICQKILIITYLVILILIILWMCGVWHPVRG